MEKIITDSRIVSDYTFATRLKSFLKDIQVNDPCSYEELDYLRRVSEELLNLQIETATDKNEKDYLKRLHPTLIE